MHALQKPELTLKEWQHPFVFISVIKEIFFKWLVAVLSKVMCLFCQYLQTEVKEVTDILVTSCILQLTFDWSAEPASS
jgi:hypothetical protein